MKASNNFYFALSCIFLWACEPEMQDSQEFDTGSWVDSQAHSGGVDSGVGQFRSANLGGAPAEMFEGGMPGNMPGNMPQGVGGQVDPLGAPGLGGPGTEFPEPGTPEIPRPPGSEDPPAPVRPPEGICGGDDCVASPCQNGICSGVPVPRPPLPRTALIPCFGPDGVVKCGE